MTSTTDFEQAAHSFLDLVAEVQPAQWSEPALGVWDVRSLVGHTARAISTVEQYLLADPAPEVTTPDAETYYGEVFAVYTDNDAIAARGVEAGKALTENSGAEFEATLGRALTLVAANGPDRIVAIGPIGIPLGEYLRTRVFELVVHGMDIAAATGLPHGIPSEVVANVADPRRARRRAEGQRRGDPLRADRAASPAAALQHPVGRPRHRSGKSR
ncbi:MAG: maleylpyruvate isomerase family mycothiol-dependent enzyme [Galbitalea sp.]